MSVKNLPRMTVLGVLDYIGGLGLDVGGDRSSDHWVILTIMDDILGRWLFNVFWDVGFNLRICRSDLILGKVDNICGFLRVDKIGFRIVIEGSDRLGLIHTVRLGEVVVDSKQASMRRDSTIINIFISIIRNNIINTLFHGSLGMSIIIRHLLDGIRTLKSLLGNRPIDTRLPMNRLGPHGSLILQFHLRSNIREFVLDLRDFLVTLSM